MCALAMFGGLASQQAMWSLTPQSEPPQTALDITRFLELAVRGAAGGSTIAIRMRTIPINMHTITMHLRTSPTAPAHLTVPYVRMCMGIARLPMVIVAACNNVGVV